ncbi:MAG: ParA family protein [Chloroflexi bacterium]|nr:ParA family protein [Chloroflexota bacterium]
MTRRIVVANQKGGVGKTTTVANLGAALHKMGKRVLLIDMDPQAALTATYGIDPYNLPRSMYSVLINENTSIARVLKPVGKGGEMAIAPASIDLAAAEVQLVNASNRAHRLKLGLDRNRIPFDFVLIDTPPSLGLLTLNGLVGATEVLVPVQTHFLAMRGVRGLMETVWRVKKKLNPELQLLGMLPTMYAENSQHAKEVVQELRSVFGKKVFDIMVHNSMKFAEVPVARQTLVDYAPDHDGALAYRKLAEEIVNG